MFSSLTIADLREKCKNAVAGVPRDALVIAVLVLASSASFGLGYLTGRDGQKPVTIQVEDMPPAEDAAAAQATGHVVASKNGTKYYLPECSGADRISPANKVSFASPEAARLAGYTPAANCKGI
jgi:hypothetical protein